MTTKTTSLSQSGLMILSTLERASHTWKMPTKGLSPDDIYVLDQVGKVALDPPGYFLRRFELVGAGEFQVHFSPLPLNQITPRAAMMPTKS